jgi:hypothetical protein
MVVHDIRATLRARRQRVYAVNKKLECWGNDYGWPQATYFYFFHLPDARTAKRCITWWRGI